MIGVIKSQLSLKIALPLAALMIVFTSLVATYVTYSQVTTMEDMTLAKARMAANLGASTYGSVLEQSIDSGAITVNDVFDREYVEVKGYNWGDNPKYHTRYDSVTDQAVLLFQDEFVKDEDFVFALGVDVNGYGPTHNSKYQAPLTGDPAKDNVGNRTKRIFKDPVGITAAKNTEPGLQQVYKRDTGVTMWDVSSPIYVKGKHWGAFRLGVSIEKINARKNALLFTLIGLFAFFALVVTGSIFGMIKSAMRPVEELTKAADMISMGEALETPIKPKTTDEIGKLTKSIDRLRSSMKAAMSRLGE